MEDILAWRDRLERREVVQPNDQYLCIVPKQTVAGGERVFLPSMAMARCPSSSAKRFR